MNLPNQPGRYLAKPVQYAIQASDDPTKQGVAWVCLYDLVFHYDRASGDWLDVSQDGLQITGYHYVIKNDGQPNTTQINQIKSALGWDGRSLSALESDGFQGSEVQIQVDSEQYQGKTKWKVNWIDPRDADPVSGGGVKRSEPAVVQSLDAKYGPILRSLNGAAKPNGTPPTKPTAAGTAAELVQAARTKAWKAFQAKNPGKVADDISEAWRTTLKEARGERDSKAFTAGDWMKVLKHIETPVESPISSEPQFVEDDIPF